jgi:hypothetical protein
MAIRFSNDIGEAYMAVIKFKIIEEWCPWTYLIYSNTDDNGGHRKKAEECKESLTKGPLYAQLALNIAT